MKEETQLPNVHMHRDENEFQGFNTQICSSSMFFYEHKYYYMLIINTS